MVSLLSNCLTYMDIDIVAYIRYRKQMLQGLNFSTAAAGQRLRTPSTFRSRETHATRNYEQSAWYKYVNNPTPNLNDPSSIESRVFRTRFRVPWKFYKDILLPWTMENFPSHRDCTGRPPIPPEYKLLSVLRMLGRGTHFDDVAEYINCGFKGEAIRVFFHEWCRLFSNYFYEEVIKPPTTDAEIKYHMDLYSASGLDGAIASTDGCHFRWDKCHYR